jgi:hypothetical protein
MDLPHSDGCFVKAYPAETAEAFCDGHVAAFEFFGGVPQSILYDNSKLAVAKIVKGGKRLRSKMFAELQSHYLFGDRFGRPGKGNDRGKVEGLVGFVRRNFMTPLPVAENFDAFNVRLLDACTKRRQAILRGHTASIAERMQADLAAFMTLPPAPYDACDKVNTRITTINRCRRATAIKRFWRRDMSTGLRLSAGVRRSLCIRAATTRPILSIARCIIWHCSSKRPRRSIKRRLWTNGACGLRSSAAAAHGSPDGNCGTARVHPGAAADGGFSPAPGGRGRE